MASARRFASCVLGFPEARLEEFSRLPGKEKSTVRTWRVVGLGAFSTLMKLSALQGFNDRDRTTPERDGRAEGNA
jgi:hypothetical protein